MTRLLLGGALGLLLTLASSAAPAPGGDGLDGTRWTVREKTFKAKIFFWRYDELSFQEGAVASAQARREGFGPAPFTASRPGESSAWTATMLSPEHGKLVWEGRKDGSRMEGTRTWMRPDGRTKTTAWSAKQRLP
ncbi:MAG: hypothetical protein HY554_09165 [Elusimicrobia bacterium]|nr:hypothetical protein [Elusimicrobiota bacterium]